MPQSPERERLVTKEQVQEHLKSNLPLGDYLQRLIDDADEAVVSRCGPHSINSPVTEVLTGGSFRLFPEQAVAEVIGVTETVGSISEVLSPDDYRSWYRGRMLERRSNGTNPRTSWGHRVELMYTPVDNDAQRRLAVIRLVQLGLQYTGLRSAGIGPYSSQNLDYTRERDAILNQLCTGTPI